MQRIVAPCSTFIDTARFSGITVRVNISTPLTAGLRYRLCSPHERPTNDLYESTAFRQRMSSRLPSLDLLKTFETVARHLSFTKAAAELFVTQSAVSRQVRQLEEHLGARLFERRTRAVVLTDAGYRYYTQLAPLLRQLDELTQEVGAAHTVRRVRITATLTLASLWLVPRLAAFQEKHPDVH